MIIIFICVKRGEMEEVEKEKGRGEVKERDEQEEVNDYIIEEERENNNKI